MTFSAPSSPPGAPAHSAEAIRLQLRSWPEVEAYLQTCKGVIVPLGSTEQHGPTGAIGTDALTAEAVALEVGRRNGVLVAFEEGTATFYALKGAEDRGQFFITPGTKVYKGMIVGEHNRPPDLELNVCKAKQVTNIRSAGAEVLDTLQAPIQMNLERALEYIGPDEMLEVTPESIRLRKLPMKKPAKR
jgi:predicted membrane GTPase involved in stress response